ncbi:PQQ-dependent sugar dehydrogenase [Dongia deserti]|uniref:PQQ-dependent sugar dehydrogenase n=1 Tax=Dongia deserti TaxID=2268030 RepID=UPI0025483122|nr:PQQ-dependent sugar dehydrogenase [Dongia deserti]
MVVRWLAGAFMPLTVVMAASGSFAAESYQSRSGTISVVTVTDGLEEPWGLAFLPDGRMLVTEKEGRLRIVAPDGRLSEPLGGVPEVYDGGQGGLLDVALDPDFASNRLVYLSYSEPGDGGAGTAVARGKLAEDRLDGLEVIWRQQPKLGTGQHFGSRLVFLPDGTMIVTLGDRNTRSYIPDMKAQIGKLVRINRDGSIPQDNPFVGDGAYSPDIYSLGHRNVQGATLHPETGQLWTVEHGARGGDEINIPEPGKNYGWPVISYGREYTGGKIGEGTSKPGLEQPVYYWDPSIAPSGMTFYTGDKFPAWKGDLFVGALKFHLLARLEVDGNRIVREERLLEDMGDRIRDVRQGPDGYLYLLTDEDDGRILRLEPAS